MHNQGQQVINFDQQCFILLKGCSCKEINYKVFVDKIYINNKS